MRVVRRVSKLGGDQLRQLGRDRVLEHLGLLVHAVPGHAERFGEVELEQPVVTQHLERDALARPREPHAVVGSCEMSPSASSRLIIAEAEAGDTSSRSASADVDTGPRPRWARDQMAFA